MEDLKSFTVVDEFDLPHCEEGEHEHFGPCPDCDAKGMQDAGKGLFKKCATCGGTREGGPSTGMQPCDLPSWHYRPGQTVKLSAKRGAALVKDGKVVEGSAEVEKEIVRAAAKRMGLLEV